MDQRRILPFYMAYPFAIDDQKEDKILRDLAYFNQLYPAKAKILQRRVAGIVDKMDYETSMIYDEYPDKMRLVRLAETILDIICKEEQKIEVGDEDIELVELILFYEIYRRRRMGAGRQLYF